MPSLHCGVLMLYLFVQNLSFQETIQQNTFLKKPRMWHKVCSCHKSSILMKGTNAIYQLEYSKTMNGTQVKLTFSFTAMGNYFLVIVTVLGLTKKEMPPGEDFIHLEIPGLCIGGGDVCVGSSQQIGNLFLMRNTEGAKKERFKHYQEHILVPGIAAQEVLGLQHQYK
jgi:hypothetical protein